MACSFLQGTSICSSVGPSLVWISAPAESSLDCTGRSFLYHGLLQGLLWGIPAKAHETSPPPPLFSDWGVASAASPSFSSTWFRQFLAFLKKHIFTEVPPAQLRASAAPCNGFAGAGWKLLEPGYPWPLLKKTALQHTAQQQPPPHHPLLTLNTETVSSGKNSWTTNTKNLERNKM